MNSRKKVFPRSWALCLFALLFSSNPKVAGQEGYWDGRFWPPEFGTATGTAIDPSGRLILAGRSLFIPAANTLSLGRWDGRTWETLATNVTTINATLAGTNDVIIGGRFNGVDGVAATNVCRFDGSAWRPFGDGLPGSVFALVNTDSGLIAGGDFASAPNSTLTNIARWDGLQWQNIGGGVPGRVLSLAWAANGAVFAASDGISNQVPASVWSWDGSNWAQIGDFGSAGARRVRRLAWMGNVLVAALAPADSNNCLVRWEGGQWIPVGDVPLAGAAESVAAGEGGLWVAGALSWVRDGETNQAGVARLVDGRWKGELAGETASGLDVSTFGRQVWVIGTMNDGISDKTGRGLWHFDDRSWGQLNNGLRYVDFTSRLAATDSRLIVTGSSSKPDLSLGLEWDGRQWQRLGVLPPQGSTLRVLREAGAAGTNLFVSAILNSGTPVTTNVLARLEGTNWIQATAPFPVSVSAITGDAGTVFAAGTIATANGSFGAVWEWDGSTWRQLGGLFGAPASPISALVRSGAELFAGGRFTNMDGAPHTHFARWDGQTWDTPAEPLDGPIVALSTDGRDLYAAGSFTSAGATVLNRVAAFRDGQWTALGGGLSLASVTALAAGRDGLVAVAGPRNSRVEVWVWRGDNWNLVGWENSGTSPVNHLLWRGHDLHVAGGFTAFGGLVSDVYALWHEAPALAEAFGYGPSGFELRFSGALPAHFNVERSWDFKTWDSVATNTPANPTEIFRDTAPPIEGAFYRATGR